MNRLNSQGYEVIWKKPISHGEDISAYVLQYRYLNPFTDLTLLQLFMMKKSNKNDFKLDKVFFYNKVCVSNKLILRFCYMNFRKDDGVTWMYAYNGSDARWVIDDDVTPPGYSYSFRVKAKNIIGWGNYSNSSVVFTHVGTC